MLVQDIITSKVIYEYYEYALHNIKNCILIIPSYNNRASIILFKKNYNK